MYIFEDLLILILIKMALFSIESSFDFVLNAPILVQLIGHSGTLVNSGE